MIRVSCCNIASSPGRESREVTACYDGVTDGLLSCSLMGLLSVKLITTTPSLLRFPFTLFSPIALIFFFFFTFFNPSFYFYDPFLLIFLLQQLFSELELGNILQRTKARNLFSFLRAWCLLGDFRCGLTTIPRVLCSIFIWPLLHNAAEDLSECVTYIYFFFWWWFRVEWRLQGLLNVWASSPFWCRTFWSLCPV